MKLFVGISQNLKNKTYRHLYNINRSQICSSNDVHVHVHYMVGFVADY